MGSTAVGKAHSFAEAIQLGREPFKVADECAVNAGCGLELVAAHHGRSVDTGHDRLCTVENTQQDGGGAFPSFVPVDMRIRVQDGGGVHILEHAAGYGAVHVE